MKVSDLKYQLSSWISKKIFFIVFNNCIVPISYFVPKYFIQSTLKFTKILIRGICMLNDKGDTKSILELQLCKHIHLGLRSRGR